MTHENTFSLELQAVELGPPEDGVVPMQLRTEQGMIACRYHPAEQGDTAVLWVFGLAAGLASRLAGFIRALPAGSRRMALPRCGLTTAARQTSSLASSTCWLGS